MEALTAFALASVALAAGLVPSRFRRRLFGVGLTAVVLAVAGWGWVVAGRWSLFAQVPILDTLLHPYLLGLYSGVAGLFGIGVILGGLARWLLAAGLAVGKTRGRRQARS